MNLKNAHKIPHASFRLNGESYNLESIKALAYNWIKEGSDNEKHLGEFILFWTDDSHTLKLETSGTTALPSKITRSKSSFIHSAQTTGSYFDLGPGQSALCCLPFSYIAAKMMFVRAWVLGLELDFIEPSSNPLSSNFKSYDFSAMVPLQVQNSISNLDQIQTLLVGGAPVSESLRGRLKGSSTAIFETYGMTETVSHIAVKNLSLGETAFSTLSGISVEVDQNDRLIIHAQKLNSKPLQTNDVVALTSKHSFVWLGRFDHVINSGGIKIFPEQLENRLRNQIKNRFFITAIPDNILGQKTILIIEGDPTEQKLDMRHIDSKMRPKEIHYTPQFFQTNSGKIKRQMTLDSLNLNNS